MPRDVVTTVYTFQELLDGQKAGTIKASAVENATAWLAEINTDEGWADYVQELWESALKQIGFMEPKLQWSGFCCQGDGASFTCDWIDLQKLLDFMSKEIEGKEAIEPDEKGEENFLPYVVHKLKGSKPTNPKYRRLLWAANNISVSVERTSHQYSHSRTCRLNADLNEPGDWDSKAEKWVSDYPRLRGLFDQFAKDAEELRDDLCGCIYSDLEEEWIFKVSDVESLTDLAEANDYTFREDGTRFG